MQKIIKNGYKLYVKKIDNCITYNDFPLLIRLIYNDLRYSTWNTLCFIVKIITLEKKMRTLAIYIFSAFCFSTTFANTCLQEQGQSIFNLEAITQISSLSKIKIAQNNGNSDCQEVWQWVYGKHTSSCISAQNGCYAKNIKDELKEHLGNMIKSRSDLKEWVVYPYYQTNSLHFIFKYGLLKRFCAS